MKKQSGITLLALIVTIIILLVIVAVVVTNAINGGLFSFSRMAGKNTDASMEDERNMSDIAGGLSASEFMALYKKDVIIKYGDNQSYTFTPQANQTWYEWATDENDTTDADFGYLEKGLTLKKLIKIVNEQTEKNITYNTYNPIGADALGVDVDAEVKDDLYLMKQLSNTSEATVQTLVAKKAKEIITQNIYNLVSYKGEYMKSTTQITPGTVYYFDTLFVFANFDGISYKIPVNADQTWYEWALDESIDTDINLSALQENLTFKELIKSVNTKTDKTITYDSDNPIVLQTNYTNQYGYTVEQVGEKKLVLDRVLVEDKESVQDLQRNTLIGCFYFTNYKNEFVDSTSKIIPYTEYNFSELYVTIAFDNYECQVPVKANQTWSEWANSDMPNMNMNLNRTQNGLTLRDVIQNVDTKSDKTILYDTDDPIITESYELNESFSDELERDAEYVEARDYISSRAFAEQRAVAASVGNTEGTYCLLDENNNFVSSTNRITPFAKYNLSQLYVDVMLWDGFTERIPIKLNQTWNEWVTDGYNRDIYLDMLQENLTLKTLIHHINSKSNKAITYDTDSPITISYIKQDETVKVLSGINASNNATVITVAAATAAPAASAAAAPEPLTGVFYLMDDQGTVLNSTNRITPFAFYHFTTKEVTVEYDGNIITFTPQDNQTWYGWATDSSYTDDLDLGILQENLTLKRLIKYSNNQKDKTVMYKTGNSIVVPTSMIDNQNVTTELLARRQTVEDSIPSNIELYLIDSNSIHVMSTSKIIPGYRYYIGTDRVEPQAAKEVQMFLK